jgi:hypothetical protein
MFHEMTHALGLDHDNRFLNIMGTLGPDPLVAGDRPVSPFPDDIFGLRYLYPSNSVTNLQVSGQKQGSDNQLDHESVSTTMGSCPGGHVSFPHTLINASSTSQTFNIRYYLAPTATGTETGYTLMTAGWTPGAWVVYETYDPNPVIPSTIPYGTYYRRIQIDSGNVVSEISESDNNAYLRRRVSIVPDCP